MGIDFSVASSKDTIRDIKAVKGADFDILLAGKIDNTNDFYDIILEIKEEKY